MKKNKNLVIWHENRTFIIELRIDDRLSDTRTCRDASSELIINLRTMVNCKEIDSIIFLSGPGSITGSRIVCATMLGIKISSPDIKFIGIRLEECISIIYPKTPIILPFSGNMMHIWDGKEWKICTIDEIDFALYTGPEKLSIKSNYLVWPNLGELLLKASTEGKMDLITPFYGAIGAI
jgi:hypothetical protein